ncbi:MAG: cytochrome P450 [Rhizomicrobium sp.]
MIDLTLMNPAYRDDSRTPLDTLREHAPIRRDPTIGAFIVTKHAFVRALLSDTTLYRNPDRAESASILDVGLRTQRAVNSTVPEDEYRRAILMLDDPDHTRIREPLAKALYKRAAKSKPLVQQIVDEYLDLIGDARQFDVVDKFARRIPIDVLARWLGVDTDRLAEFRKWSEGFLLSLKPARTPADDARLRDATNAFSAYMRELMVRRRSDPRDDLVTDMVQLQAEGAPLTDGELSANLQALLAAGNYTTTDIIGSAILLLLQNPDQLERLRADPSLIVTCVEEALRYHPPVEVTGRIASRELNVGGCPVHPSQSMFMSLRGANHDPEAFPEPQKFDIARKDAPHVAFGGGQHVCIGAPLARMEAHVAILSFVQRFPGLRLAHPDAKPKWRDLGFFRGLEELIVTV